MARFLLALATFLLLAGCTSSGNSGSASSSASSSAAHRTAGTSSSAGASASAGAPAGGSASGSAPVAATSAPSVAPNGAVSKSTYTAQGGVWPLTVTGGALSCQFGTQVVFSTPDGNVYGVNSAAVASGEWNDINTIRADDPKHPGHKLPLDDLIATGQALC